MCIHLGLVVQRKEPLQKLEGISYDMLRDAMVSDVEEATVVTSIVYLHGNLLLVFRGRTVDLGQVDSWYRGERRWLLSNLSVSCLRSGVEVHILTAILPSCQPLYPALVITYVYSIVNWLFTFKSVAKAGAGLNASAMLMSQYLLLLESCNYFLLEISPGPNVEFSLP